MKLTRKLFVAIMTMALLVVTFSASTFAWFTLGTNSKIEDINVNVMAAKGMEISIDGKKWVNNLNLTDDSNAVEFVDLTSSDGISIKTMANETARKEASGNDKAQYFEKVIYVRITKTENTPDYTKIVLNYVAGKNETFVTTDGADELANGETGKMWLSDATVTGSYKDNHGLEENKYYRFDTLNAVKISFQGSYGENATCNTIYGYENSESWGTASTNGLAKEYAVAKDYDTTGAPSTVPSSYTTYTASVTTADTNGFVKYDTAAANTEKGNVLVASDFGKGATKTGLTTVVFDDDNYVYAKLTIRVWLEGWDADCINAILEKNTVINLGLSAE